MRRYRRARRSDSTPTRNLRAVMLRLDGFTYREIAEFTGCGVPQRAAQVCRGDAAIEVGLILRAIRNDLIDAEVEKLAARARGRLTSA